MTIISGGQTGVDQGALDAALSRGWPCGGTCPKGRRSEDGRIPDRYPLTESTSLEWHVRTRINVQDADATLVLSVNHPLEGGTRLTAEIARAESKALLVLVQPWEVDEVVAWILEQRPYMLNVAGPRESGAPGIGRAAAIFVGDVLDALTEHPDWKARL